MIDREQNNPIRKFCPDLISNWDQKAFGAFLIGFFMD